MFQLFNDSQVGGVPRQDWSRHLRQTVSPSIYSLHFTSLDLSQEGRGDSRQTNTSFFAITNNRTNRSASGIQVAPSLGEAAGGAAQCNAMQSIHYTRIVSHHITLEQSIQPLKGPGRPPSVVITVGEVTSATAATNDSLGSWLR